jgi:DNA-binding NarL/FixJ family response regulator
VLAIAVGAVCVLGWLARVGFLADGLWVCDHLRAAGLATRALVLTMYDDVTVLAALRAGGVRLHTQGAGPDETVPAVWWPLVVRHSWAPGSRRACFSASAAQRSALSRAHRALDRGPGVVGRGRDNAGVARRLGVSPETVHNHASNIITMLHVSDRSGAIFRARDAGLGGPLGRAELPLPLVSRSSSAIIDDHRR